MKATIFYSWQSDTKAAANRTLIQDALEGAVKELRAESSLAVEPVVDRDTQEVPGAPDIDKIILEKIDASAAVVADVTIINQGGGRPTPNPNVLIELGYALKSLGWRKTILVQNLAFGGPEDLPFDLRQKRSVRYNSPEDAPNRADVRKNLQAQLRTELHLILADADTHPGTQYPVELSIDYEKKNIHGERHDYQLQVTLTNRGTKPITEWHTDITLPTRLLNPNTTYSLRVAERSDKKTMFFRADPSSHGQPIYPGDSKRFTVDYHVDFDIFLLRSEIFAKTVTATAYVHGELAANVERRVEDLQCF